MASKLAVAVSAVFLLRSAPALATYSIVAANSATREVGGTGTSCLGGSDVSIIYGPVPGAGVIHAQAQFNENGRRRGMELLAVGTATGGASSAGTAGAGAPTRVGGESPGDTGCGCRMGGHRCVANAIVALVACGFVFGSRRRRR